MVVGNARQRDVLEKAGARAASALIAATEDAVANMSISLIARELNPSIRVVLRMFDAWLAEDIRRSFGFAAFSASALAAPAFAAATSAAVKHSVFVNGVLLNRSRLTIASDSLRSGRTVGEIEQELDRSILVDSGPEGIDFHLPGDLALKAGDQIVLFAPLEAPAHLECMNQGKEEPGPSARKGALGRWDRLRRWIGFGRIRARRAG